MTQASQLIQTALVQTPSVQTLCPYCGVGCGLEAVSQPTERKDQRIETSYKIRGDRNHPSSQGMVCVKGATIMESIAKDRLLYPMLRENLDSEFKQISWEQALDRIVQEIEQTKQQFGVDAICMYGSGQFQTEDYYVAQKLFKGCLGTNNFDANSRLCMSSAVSGYIKSLGSDGPPCCYQDLDLTDCAFIIGSNMAECHPILFNRLRRHHKTNPGVKLIVVDPRCTPTAAVADLHLGIQPGTDIDLLNGIAYLLLKWERCDRLFIDQHTEGFAQFCELVQYYDPAKVARTCGISEVDLETAAKYWAESQSVLSLWSMGINQSAQGTAKVQSIINLHLLTAQIGKPGAGPFSLTGQPNAMGGREAGGLSHLLPGYRSVKNAEHRQELEQHWQLLPGQISPTPGRSAWDIIRGIEQNEVQLLWIAATNPVVSFPDLERTKKALTKSRFTIYQDAYYPTETSSYSHLLLPATQWSEKTGTMTNSERMVSLCPAFQPCMGESRHDWEIFADVGRRLGFERQFYFQNSGEVYAEFAKITQNRVCDHSGISHQILATVGAIQLPCSSPETRSTRISNKRLYTDWQFNTPNRKAQFTAYHSKGMAEPLDSEFPLALTTGRLYGHWHTQTRTGRITKIKEMHPNPFIEIHPKDAQKLGIENQDLVEVRSKRGMARFPALITTAIAPGVVFVPMHWGYLWADQAEANALTHPLACPDSLQPELKACAVQIKRIEIQTQSS